VRYAAQHPERVAGLVLIDGAYPIAMFDEAGKQKVRAQFHRLGWIMRILAALGRSARMSPAEAEASNKRVSVFATTPYNHMQILNKAPDTVVAAIEDVIHHSS
jgi:pimeloyl-ACP methyl ester carboxylesterase